MSSVDIDLTPYLSRIPLLADVAPSSVSRLGGLTNLNFLVTTGDIRCVLRVPGAGTSEYIDRTAESFAARSAADAGVNAELLFFDPTDGLMLTRHIDGAATMSAALFTDLDAVARAARAFHVLHHSAAPFDTDFHLFAMIDEYKSLLAAKGATLPKGYNDAQRLADTARRALEAQPVRLVPCHCDPLCANFLDTGERMFIIDYEYAGNNDPTWDLGDLSVEAGFDDEQDHALLVAYFGGEPPADQVGRMVAHKALCDLLWTLWGVIQHVNGNTADDFWAYAVQRFERCQTLMATPAFAGHVAAIGSPKGRR